MKEEIKYITFSGEPKVIIYSEKSNLSELSETVKVTINTTKRNLSFNIYKGYSWKSRILKYFLNKNKKIINNKIINKIINIIILYKYMTEFKVYIINEVIKDKISTVKYFYFIFKVILWLLRAE